MDLIEKKISDKLKETSELEGMLFVEISLVYCGRDYVVRRISYTVKDGVVHGINEDGSLYVTGDTLWNLKRDCHKIGKYNPNLKNQNKPKLNLFSYIIQRILRWF